MANIRCGNCKQSHTSVEEVKACYATKVAIPGLSVMALKPQTITVREYQAPEFPDSTKYRYGGKVVTTKQTVSVPDARYALANLPGHANGVTFFSVKHGKAGSKWENFQFVTRLVGGKVGDFVEYPVRGDARAIVLRKIADNALAAAKAFADEFSVCARCGRTLTDDESRSRGLGPDCAQVF